jgi:membrane fusion protein, copper/silver efflux system
VKTSTNVIVMVLAFAVLGTVAAGSYWLGARSPAREAAGASATATGATPAKPQRKLLYYRNPMGLADTSPTPKKDPMGMDYTPVYEGEDEDSGTEPGTVNQIRISTDKVQKLGVRTEPAAKRLLGKLLRAAGRIEPDERRVVAISPRFEGFVEQLHVNVTGQYVAKGQPLFEVYSPELMSAQREYLIAMQGVAAMKDADAQAQGSMQQLAQASLARLRNWDFSVEQVDALVARGQATRTITFRSPVSGVVTEKKALQGMRFMPGEMLYQVTDLSSVWVLADVFEQDIALIKLGAKANVNISAYPNQAFEGRITYVYPTLKAETRTVPVRIELANSRHLLKPAMYAQVELQVGAKTPVLTVPDSAVIDSGTRRIVLVQVSEGRFEPREVELGARAENYVEVIKGVRDGELVVVAANFLIDAESNLKAAVGGMGAPAAAAPAPSAVGHKTLGQVDSVDASTGTLTLKHEPVPALKWPAMTMEFKAAHSGLLRGLKPGQAVSFEFVERQPGEYVVTSIGPATPVAAPASAAAGSHNKH